VRYFVRHPTTQAMPRRSRPAFTANDDDNAITGIHDMAFIPACATASVLEVRVGGAPRSCPDRSHPV